jgi:hypothetical protein
MNSEQEGAAPRATGKRWSSRLSALIGIAISVAIFFWLIKGIAENWDELSGHLSQVSFWALASVVALYLVFSLFVSLCYFNSLRLAGADVSPIAAIGVYLASQLGKYVPGKVLYVAGQIGLAKWLRISLSQSILGFTAHHIQLGAMGLLIASPLLGVSLSRGVVVGIAVLAVVGFLVLVSGIWIKPFNAVQRRRHKPEMESFSPVYAVRALLSAGIGWVCYGCIAAVLTIALLPEWSPGTISQVGMAAVAAWLLGFFSFITPVGIGVREGAFVMLTRSIIPEPTAMTVAIMMRLIHTGVQVPIGAVALAHSIKSRPENRP